jgi:hypothetical protein
MNISCLYMKECWALPVGIMIYPHIREFRIWILCFQIVISKEDI